VSALLIHAVEIDFGYDDFFAIRGGFFDDLASRVADKTPSPEFDAVAPVGRFMADPVRSGDVAAIGDGVATLDGLP
jgi:hypothetical protein